MISCNLQGGLGNQMFQIAATYALAKRNNDTALFNFETCHTPLQGNPSLKYKGNILHKVPNSTEIKTSVVYHEPSFGYNELPYAPNLLLNGYFQSEKYFEDCKEDIKKMFKPDSSLIGITHNFLYPYWVQYNQTVFIHIRRGDYLKNPDYHPVCEVSYYEKAMAMFDENTAFIVVSDDMEWAKENIKGPNVAYSPFDDEIMDFYLMTQCNNGIISNSSFSWWAAWLIPDTYWNREKGHPNKKIIAPKKWFGPKGPKDTQDIIPKDWEIVE